MNFEAFNNYISVGTIIAMLIGAWLSFMAISRQTEKLLSSAIEVQRRTQQQNIKIGVYDRLNTHIDALVRAAAVIDNTIRFTPIFAKDEMQRLGGSKSPIFGIKTQIEINDEFFKYIDSINTVLSTIEGFEIIHPRLKMFRFAFLSHMFDLNTAYREFSTYYMDIGPFITFNNSGQETRVLPTPLSQNTISTIQTFASNYEKASQMVACCAMDLRNEMQNHLLGKIFDHKIEDRVPIDKRYYLHKLDDENAEKLINHFLNDTPWGLDHKQKQEMVKAHFGIKD